MAKTAPFGTWASPITTDAILEGGANVSEVFVDPITSTIYHVEGRPLEGGRSVIVKTEEGGDVFGRDWNARTGVQEYGGGPATAYNGNIYFSNFNDNRVYMIKDGNQPNPITPDNKNHRFAKFDVHPIYTHLLVAIMEDHTNPLPQDVVTTLCLINTKTCTVSTLISGADFYAFPYFSPDGSRLAWQQWNHPDMPWDGAEIHVAEVSADENNIALSHTIHVAGKKSEITAIYPSWASKDVLLFICDESGYQNPWSFSVSSGKASPILPTPVEFDFGEPMHSLGVEYGAVLDAAGTKAIYTTLKNDKSMLFVVTLRSGALEEIECPYVGITSVRRITEESIVFLGDKSDAAKSIVICSLTDYAKPQYNAVKHSFTAPKFPHSLISVPQSIVLNVPPNDEVLHVLYLPPKNPDYSAPDDEKPPCIVNSHGGPIGRASMALDWQKQYFTSRGWAWMDVNYGGSTGYGRKYMERLTGKWGIVDVEDCIHAMQQLSAPPYSLIDAQRSVIRGGSAGGYTTLVAISNHPNAFAAATSLFGIADLRGLAADTHKFESHFLEKLIGGTLEEIPEVYKERSPVFHADKIKTPLLVLQGSIDAVVPPSQAEVIVKAIKGRGGRVEYTIFEGEGHGWRKAETIKAALEQELHFYEDIFGIKGSSA